MRWRPTYLRVIAVTDCPLKCSFCHAEGSPFDALAQRSLPIEPLTACLEAAARIGVHKFKFLGGEPLVRRDLPEVVRRLRAVAPGADLSVITSGVAGPDRVAALFAAGLDRMNLSIHGWSIPAFAERGGTPRGHALRQQNLDQLLALERFLKLNYVYVGPRCEDDLAAFLAWAAARPVVVAVLDDLSDPTASAHTVRDVVKRLAGSYTERVELDPHSLPTARLSFASGLEVEIKTERLGLRAPYTVCASCPLRGDKCREGIVALRLTERGRIRPCMDRPDLEFDLATLAPRGPDAMAEALEAWLAAVLP